MGGKVLGTLMRPGTVPASVCQKCARHPPSAVLIREQSEKLAPERAMADHARDRFGQWARTMLAHRHGRHGVHHDAERAHTVYQTSTIGALLAGIYDGEVTITELLTHGDFGLGTFNRLDGEMLVLDGVCYHLRADASITVADGDDLTPFAVVTWFYADTTISIASRTTRTELLAMIDRAVSSANLIHAIRITGSFAHVRTRTVVAQAVPYPPLTKATAEEPITDFAHLPGTLAGFRMPDYEQGISVAGYHFHFIDDHRRRGGHALDFELHGGEIAVCSSSELHLSVPRSGAFLAADLSPADIAEQVHRAED